MTPATSYPLAEELNTWIIIITLSSALKICLYLTLLNLWGLTQSHPRWRSAECQSHVLSVPWQNKPLLVCQAISRGAGTMNPECLWFLCTWADRCNCCWCVSELSTFKKPTSERQNLLHIHLSQFARHTKRRARSGANWLESRWTV